MIFKKLINSHQQIHQNKFVTDFFIKRLKEISDKLVLVHFLVWVDQLYKNAR